MGARIIPLFLLSRCNRRVPRAQRFGIEGCEALLPGLEALVERAASRGVSRVEVGMPHRGRLNVRL